VTECPVNAPEITTTRFPVNAVFVTFIVAVKLLPSPATVILLAVIFVSICPLLSFIKTKVVVPAKLVPFMVMVLLEFLANRSQEKECLFE